MAEPAARAIGRRWAIGFFALMRIVGDALERPSIADFYAQPTGALDGAPGSIVKSQDLIGVPLAARAWRIMYRSTDLRGDPVILWGHSQGGQAVLFAAQDAATYAPELRIEAVAAAAPAADLTALMSAHLDDISGVTIGSYAFSAFSEVYESVPGTALATILTPQAVEIQPKMNALCLLTNIPELHAIGGSVVGAFTRVDPTTTAPWADLLVRNSAGASAFDAPLFIAQGLSDQLVIPADTTAFVAHERALGLDVTYATVSIADHGSIAYLAIPDFLSWLTAHGL